MPRRSPKKWRLCILERRYTQELRMPTIWRFLLGHYLMVLSLCLVAFIAILLTLRLDEIAQFAALGASSPHLLKFVLYQIPYILPLSMPLSALISTVILMQRLSSSY